MRWRTSQKPCRVRGLFVPGVRFGQRCARLSRVDEREAVDRLLAVVPEFGADCEGARRYPTGEDEDRDLPLHGVMADLAPFYMGRARSDQELAARFWRVVEELASYGDDEVKNAIHVSLIQWFACGDEDEQAALMEAEPHQGRATWVMVQAYRPRTEGSRSSDRRRARRSRRRQAGS